ncbi:hypothetical protein [Thermomonospora cellulosilytica]|uniref:Uncharacterized protein n=1 Tax=Thermomonospora cellulosilytica TaxID=1411118 RepID=A0A7W3MVR9_9ACTN|nr:hypothetical protein [Thermomonospora cellulosilytica]MBA9002795.1 hypothetical protein [Thermomonospora cellulosilytica]
MSRQITLGAESPSMAILEHRVRVLEETVTALSKSITLLAAALDASSPAAPPEPVAAGTAHTQR